MRIALGSDHAGYRLKERLRQVLKADGHEVDYLGPDPEDRSTTRWSAHGWARR